ncbi:MAG: hypothetical protein CL840_14515 [Crocinitomicaceae bacterium]|nr:hypothetical protein [Crocinitomicaceae bacterium]
MNNFKTSSILGAFLISMFLSVNAFAQDSHVVVRVYEPVNQAGEIVISYGNGKSERIPIEKLNSEHHEVNANKIVDVFNRLAKEGYSLESSAGSSHGNTGSILHVDTFVFVKDED